MAIDQAIFELHAAGMAPSTVRVYEWGLPALSIGRLQRAGDAVAEFPGLPWVRRPTGGSAVRHGDDWTISVMARQELVQPLAERRGVLASYFLLVAPIIAALEEYGIKVARGDRDGARNRSADCFARVAACDLVDAATGAKIAGCAQLQASGAILQQMSLRPLQKVRGGRHEFEERLRRQFGAILQVHNWSIEHELAASEWSKAREIYADSPAAFQHSTKETDD